MPLWPATSVVEGLARVQGQAVVSTMRKFCEELKFGVNVAVEIGTVVVLVRCGAVQIYDAVLTT